MSDGGFAPKMRPLPRKRAALVAAVRDGAEEMSRVLGLSGEYIAAR